MERDPSLCDQPANEPLRGVQVLGRLELLLSDEVTRRESRSAMLRAKTAALDPTTRLDTWDEPENLHYDRTLWSDLTSLRFTDAHHGVLETEMRRLARVELLILDDFALRPLDATQTSDFYELVVERHRKTTTICTSNREPAKWLTMMSDPLLAQSAVDRLTSTAHTLISEGPSYRQREHPSPRGTVDPDTHSTNIRRSHVAGLTRRVSAPELLYNPILKLKWLEPP